MKNVRTILLWSLAISAGCSRNSPGGQSSVSDIGVAAGIDSVRQLLPQETVNRYRAALPKFGYKRISDIVNSSDTFWYDKQSMIPTYQDTVGHTQSAPIGMRRNNEGAGLIIPAGRRLFTEDGQRWSFPFAHTAGTDKSTNTVIANFLALPRVDGKILPVAYWIVNRGGARGNLGLLQRGWLYPKGTLIGEMIFVKDEAGELYLTELRTRERHLVGWSANVYRPFPTAAALAAAIKTKQVEYQNNPNLQQVVAHLEGTGTLRAVAKASVGFPGTFSANGFVDDVPEIQNQQLVKDLLRNTTFVSTYGEVWKTVGDQESFAPSTNGKFSIVPNNFEAGILDVRDRSCARCHVDAQRAVVDFVPDAILYGDIWGSDDIFSFHPFDQSRYSADGNENRSLRPEFQQSGMVERYDAARHPPQYYRNLREPKE